MVNTCKRNKQTISTCLPELLSQCLRPNKLIQSSLEIFLGQREQLPGPWHHGSHGTARCWRLCSTQSLPWPSPFLTSKANSAWPRIQPSRMMHRCTIRRAGLGVPYLWRTPTGIANSQKTVRTKCCWSKFHLCKHKHIKVTSTKETTNQKKSLHFTKKKPIMPVRVSWVW